MAELGPAHAAAKSRACAMRRRRMRVRDCVDSKGSRRGPKGSTFPSYSRVHIGIPRGKGHDGAARRTARSLLRIRKMVQSKASVRMCCR
jgi:hypothetical protein